MIHTMHFIGFGRSHDEAMQMAETIANRTFPAIALLTGQRISKMSPLLLPDLAPATKQVAVVYALDVPAGGGELLDARRAEVEQEVRSTFPTPSLDQFSFPFRAAIGLSPRHRATRQLGPYTIIAEQEPTTMYRVLVQLRSEEPHLSELCGNLDKCEDLLRGKGIPLDGWLADETSEGKQETDT